MTDKNRIDNAFKEYTDRYDSTDLKIKLKIDHTYRVADNAVLIARDIGLDEKDVFLSYCMGVLHDFGRFEQVKTYGTFVDRASVDHAELGADLLFKKGHFNDFFDEGDMSPEILSLTELVIRQHNKLTLPEGLSERETLFCNIIRDADKVDIFRVLAEIDYEDRNVPGMGNDNGIKRECARDSIMQCVREKRCVKREPGRSRFEIWISRMCMAFELVYPMSRKLTKEQGCLARILQMETSTPQEEAQMEEIRSALSYYL